MVQYIHTPYPTPTHLLTLRSQFYPPSPSTTPPSLSARQKELAVARVALWSHRGSCPHLVESTALLTAVILSDNAGQTNPSTLRAAYVAAFGRFVTGLLDSHQDKARKQSMYELAKGVGLPAKFVELRHMGVHEGLPSLVRLRGGAGEGLGWIYEYYWKHLREGGDQETEMEGVEQEGIREEGEEEKVEGLVRRYLELGETVGERLRKEILLGGMRGFELGMVRGVVERVVERSLDGKVVRRGLALVRELDGETEGGVDMVVGQVGKKAEGRGMVPEGEDVRMAEVEVIPESTIVRETPREEQPQHTIPSWVLYDEGEWVPKPIGVV